MVDQGTDNTRQDFVPPVIGERVPTPDGKGDVKSVQTYKQLRNTIDKDFEVRLRGRLGDAYRQKYFRVTVELIDSKDIETYHSWEIRESGWDPDRDIESAWRTF
jgi:hypothetical protein